MRLDKNFWIVLSAFILTNVVIYPPIQELGDNIRDEVVLKSKVRILVKNFKKGFSFTPLMNKSLTDDFYQFKTQTNISIFTLTTPTLNLSILSTIKLIL
jgi:hypothetical protein